MFAAYVSIDYAELRRRKGDVFFEQSVYGFELTPYDRAFNGACEDNDGTFCTGSFSHVDDVYVTGV